MTSTSQRPEIDGDNFGTGKKIKIRHTRVKTGCRDCRMRRIKCPEGILMAEGAKLPCKKCDETGTACWYPAPDDSGRVTTRWIRAAVLDKDGRAVITAEDPMTFNLDVDDVASAVPDLLTALHPIHQQTQHPQQTPLQPPIPVFEKIKQERPPTAIQHFINPPPSPQSVLSEVPIAGPSYLGASMFAESSSRNAHQPMTVLSPIVHPYPQHPPIGSRQSEPGITLPRILKGNGTFRDTAERQRQEGIDIGNFPVWNSLPYVLASPTYDVPEPKIYNVSGSSSRRLYTNAGRSAARSTRRRLEMYQQPARLPWSPHDNVHPGEFPLQLTRIPWMKRKPMHVDYTKRAGRQSQASLDALMETGAAAASPLVIADNLHRYLTSVNSPVRPLRSFTLASLLTSPLEQTAMAYFETNGCGDIAAVGEMKSNWIYAQMFPRVHDLLATSFEKAQRPGTLPKRSKSSGTDVEIARVEARQYVKEYVYHSLIRLSCVHGANKESEPSRIEALRREVWAHEKRAMMAGLMARIHFPESAWKTEEYLMGTYIGYMADTLLTAFLPHDPLVPVKQRSGTLLLSTSKDAGAVAMDAGLVRPLEMEASPARPASAPVRATIIPAAVALACASPSSSSAAAISVSSTARPVLARGVEEDWVESFFGLTREMILGMGQVNEMVARRAEMLRSGTEDGEAGWALRRAAEKMVVQLGGGGGAGGGVVYGREDKGKARQSGSAFEVIEMAPGRSGRIRRGTTVTSLGLLIIVLCELLHVDLEDERLTGAAERALEMVADSKPSETAGLSWALTVSIKGGEQKEEGKAEGRWT
ncbi:hypothetical protein QFC24_006426 [Naganishia onofrii]|uniref:Uncharacterized protein n=1 Tax=Naganishia onofrii TaxID=1851511 RepID=A0ACC2X1F5_9TREE|nr:hypothetical protein QFC24_006426 [Naganishia onofrii]